MCIVNDISEELSDLDMEPKPESLRWASAFKDEEKITLRMGSRARAWELPFRDVFEVLGERYHRDGKGFHAERTMCKGMGSWWRDKNICRSKTVPRPSGSVSFAMYTAQA